MPQAVKRLHATVRVINFFNPQSTPRHSKVFSGFSRGILTLRKR
jgi:hypothetical protein